MGFKIGEKVVCVKAIDGLIKGEIYTVKSLMEIAMRVIEYDESTEVHYIHYYNWRFRKVDYKFADELLKTLEQDLVNS